MKNATEVQYGFGPHLMLDCYGCPREKLGDMDLIFNTLDTFPPKIGMNKIMPPYVFKYVGKVPEDWGISGVVLIAESHISIHTFPDKDHAFIDIFSCKDFDTDYARRELLPDLRGDPPRGRAAKPRRRVPEEHPPRRRPRQRRAPREVVRKAAHLPLMFLGSNSPYDQARFVVIPCPHEATTSYGKGTKRGPAAILNAFAGLELFDEELGDEPSRAGITLSPHQSSIISLVTSHRSSVFGLRSSVFGLQSSVSRILRDKKIPVILGGEHSLTPVAVKPVKEKYH